jgi:hypothetical protein
LIILFGAAASVILEIKSDVINSDARSLSQETGPLRSPPMPEGTKHTCATFCGASNVASSDVAPRMWLMNRRPAPYGARQQTFRNETFWTGDRPPTGPPADLSERDFLDYGKIVVETKMTITK